MILALNIKHMLAKLELCRGVLRGTSDFLPRNKKDVMMVAKRSERSKQLERENGMGLFYPPTPQKKKKNRKQQQHKAKSKRGASQKNKKDGAHGGGGGGGGGGGRGRRGNVDSHSCTFSKNIVSSSLKKNKNEKLC